MAMVDEKRPIREPYSEGVRAELDAAWAEEKERLMEADVTIPKNVEPLARRLFFAGYIAAMNAPAF